MNFEPRTSDPLDRLASLTARLLGAPAAFISVPADDRVTLKGREGGCGEVSIAREGSFSHHVLGLGAGGVLVVEDALADPRFADSPLVTAEPGIRFYAGAAITDASGQVVGALSVVDREPRPAPGEAQLDLLRAQAEAAGALLDQQAMLHAAREKLETLSLAESISGVGYWRVEVATRRMTWSDQLFRLHRLEPGAFEPDLARDVRYFHPEDRPRLQAAVDRAIRKGESYDLRLRLILDDGSERLAEVRGAPRMDETGRVTALFGVVHDITDQQAALETARRNERRYRLLADNMADVIARVKADGRGKYISPAVEDILGYSPEEMAGALAQDYVLEEDRPIFMAALAGVMATGENRQVQYRVVHKDGRIMWAEAHLRRVESSQGEGEAMMVIRPIDDRRALEDQIREALAKSQKSEQRYRLLAENMGDVITRVKADGSSKYISSAIQPLLGWRFDEMSGQSLDYVYPDDRTIVLETIQGAIRDGCSRTLQHRAVHRDGRVLWLESHFRAMSDESRALGEAVVVMRDISDRKALEADLMAARDRAEAGARAKSEFLANMSHELRTPLTSVVGFAGLLKHSADMGAEERRHVDRIAAGSEALLAVINDILDYSKLEAGGVELDAQPFALCDLTRGAMELMEAQCEAKGLALNLEIDAAGADALVGDATRLRQVLLNFLSNAVKFTAEGGITVAVSSQALDDGQARLEVSVTDTGIGVSAETVDQLFERFTQADASTTRNFGGTGLGLAISRQLVEKMGGQIGATGATGRGSTFWFRVTLPLAEAAAAERTASAGLAPMRAARILVADDAPANRELVGALLSGMGLEVSTVENGAAAVEAMAREAFDLVLMDVHMPVMDGLTAARAIRRLNGDAALTPIIALTANVGLDQAQACLQAGMNGHLAKPINVARLAQTLSVWLNATDDQARVA